MSPTSVQAQLCFKAYPADADLIVGVPDSGITAAQGFAAESEFLLDWHSIKTGYRPYLYQAYSEGTGISVRLKLSVLESAVKGKILCWSMTPSCVEPRSPI